MTKKQDRFVKEYLIDLNGTQAAIRAGYSPKTANEQASRLLANVSVKKAIDKAIAERSRRTGISADRVVRELAKIGFANIGDVVDLNTAKIKDSATEDDLACIQAVKIKPTEWGIEREVRMYDKKGALVDLGRHLGIFNDRIEISGLDNEKKKLDDILQKMRGDG